AGWSKTFNWKIKPNGAWTNGNAPINVLITFYDIKSKESKKIEFTIANPYILDEQYSGSIPTLVQTSGITPGAAAPMKAPFVPVIAALAVMLAIWWWRRG
ncbi:MAG: hypothetical protein O8C55_00005, partial [Candidatus Methanoperedens sp.]|nr:hypothetical protein [Candidatus Methanoperedens sp.]